MRRIFAILVMMALLLPLCFSFSGCTKVSAKDYTQNPAGTLMEALGASNKEFFADDAGMGKVIAKAVRGGSVDFSLESPLLGKVEKVSGILYMNGKDKDALLDATLRYDGEDLNATCYVNEQGIALGSSAILGSDRVLGFYPGKLADRFGDSALPEALGLSAALQEQIDTVLAEWRAAWNDIYADSKEAEKKFHEAVNDMLTELSPAVTTEKVTITGKEAKYVVATYTVTNATLRAFGDKWIDTYAKTLEPVFQGVADDAQYDIAKLRTEFDELMDKIDEEYTLDLKLQFYINRKTERLERVAFVGTSRPNRLPVKATEVNVTVTFGKETIALEALVAAHGYEIKGSVVLSRTVAGDVSEYRLSTDLRWLDRNDYCYELTLRYDQKDGSFELKAEDYFEQVNQPATSSETIPPRTVFALSGTLEVERKKVTLTIDSVTALGITPEIKCVITVNADADMPPRPENVTDVTDLTAGELQTILNEITDSKFFGIFTGKQPRT